MIEVISAFSKAVGHLSLAWLIGGNVFLLLGGRSADNVLHGWQLRMVRTFPWAAALLLAATALGLMANVAITAGLPAGQFIPSREMLEAFAFDTRAGRFASFRLAACVPLLFVAILFARSGSATAKYPAGALVFLLAVVIGALGPVTGHTSGYEERWWLTPLHIAHALCMYAWLGGLPGWIGLVRTVWRSPTLERSSYAARTLRRFSYLAMFSMLVIVSTGVVLAFWFVDTQGALLGTSYGLLICAKLVLLAVVLAIANHARTRLLPAMETLADAQDFYPLAVRWITIELVLAAAMLGLGSVLSQTTPALHDQPYWWLPLRLSYEATWIEPPTPLIVTLGAGLVLAALIIIGMFRHKLTSGRRIGVACVGAFGAIMALWYISVPAYPDTYRKSDVAYLTVSIANGITHYQAQCVSCHGTGALGDGAEAPVLPKPPADLSAPHTALHTSGDMFWWLTHGIPDSGMPGLADALNEQDRWDVINFLRAFSLGYEARFLSYRISPGKPWLGAPNFYYENRDGQPAQLKDFREQSNVLLVFLKQNDQQTIDRLNQLALEQSGLMVIVVSAQKFANLSPRITHIQNAAEEIHLGYELLSRTLSNRGDSTRIGMDRSHMEFLIDRFGYIRARWIPEDESGGWSDSALLMQQVTALSAEPRILQPPDDHVH